MCVKEFIGFNCGHCALPTLRGCPIVSQSPHFPYCRYPAERPIPVPENCPSCARVVWNQRTLANEESHREMHYRLGREECVFDSEKGSCETRFDIDIEREGASGGRQIRHVGYERVLVPGQMQIETSGWNAERSEGGAVVAMMRRKVPKGRKSSREIEEAIARVEARFAAINVETSRRAAIEGALSSPGQAYVASPGRSDNDPELHTQKSLLDGTSGPRMEIERQVNDYPNPRNRYGPGQLSSIEACSPHFGSQVPTGNAYTGYQFSNEAVGHGALLEKKNPNNAKDENDAGRQLDAARLPGERKIRVQNYIGTTKYYPGKEQYRGASWDEVIANVKYKPDSVVPRGPRDKHERNAQSRGTAQQFTPQMLCSNFSGPAPGMSALPVAGIRGSQSTAPEEISAAAQRPDPHVPQAGPLSVHHPELESVLEYSPRNRPYRGPAIVSSDMAISDMAISDMAIRGYT